MTAKEFDPVAFMHQRTVQHLIDQIPYDINEDFIALAAEAAKQQSRKDAEIAGRYWAQLKELCAAHYGKSSDPFRPEAFGFSTEVVKWSKDCAQAIEKEAGL